MTRIVFSVLFSFSAVICFSQFEFGLKAGLSSADLANKNLILDNNDQHTNIALSIEEASYGFHFGIYSRVKIFNIYIEPAILFNSSQVNYKLREEIFDTGVTETIKSEKFEKLDIPVLAGMKFGFFRIQAGPVAHLHLNSISELTDIKGYSEKFKKATYGYQIGVGIDILKVRLDVNYEGNLSKYGDHITIDGQSYSFGESPSRIVASLGYKF